MTRGGCRRGGGGHSCLRCLLPALGVAAPPSLGLEPWCGSWFCRTHPLALAAHPAGTSAACSPPASHETFGGPCGLCPGLSFLPGPFAGISLKAQPWMFIPVSAQTRWHTCKGAGDNICAGAWAGAGGSCRAQRCPGAGSSPTALLLCAPPSPAVPGREERGDAGLFHLKVSRGAACRHRAFVQQLHVPSRPGMRPAVILLKICAWFEDVVPNGGKLMLISASKCHRNVPSCFQVGPAQLHRVLLTGV